MLANDERDRWLALEHRFEESLAAAKLASLAEFAAGAGHEMNNPLAVIAGRAQLLLRGETDTERRRDLATIHAQALRVHEMIADLMLFARPPTPELADCDLAAIVMTVVRELAARAADQQTATLTLGVDRPCPIVADARQLAVALRAIVVNALQARASGGTIVVALTTPADRARLTITDDGPGVSAEVRPHAFDPFYSGRNAGRGLGLGLSKAWRIVTNHGGRLTLDDTTVGAQFTIELPHRRQGPATIA